MDNKKGLILFILLTVIVGCGPKGAQNHTGEAQMMGSVAFKESTLKVALDTISLGSMTEGEVVVGLFGIENQSSEPLAILDIKTGCGCTSVTYDNQPIPAGGSRSVEFRFDSKGRFGSQVKDIVVMTSIGSAVVTITGQVKEK